MALGVLGFRAILSSINHFALPSRSKPTKAAPSSARQPPLANPSIAPTRVLVSVCWTLRRIAGRPRPVPTPTQINVRNTSCEGQAEARWTRVVSVQCYIVKAFTSATSDSPENIPWDSLPVIPGPPYLYIFPDKPVGSYLTVRVRAVGSKGPSPWTENATVRVY